MKAAAAVLVAITAALLLAPPAAACATCFGAADSSLTRGMNGAIVTLLAIVAAVQLGFVALFATFVRRAKRLRQRRERFRLIRGGTN